MREEIGAQVAGDYQPLNDDLTAIAALTTASYGRSLLSLADVSALRDEIAEVGFNANGSYLRLKIGVQFCWRVGSLATISSPAGNIFVNGAALPPLAWPASFASEPHEIIVSNKFNGIQGHSWAASVDRPSATQTSSVQLFRSTASGDSFFPKYLAVGTY